MLKVNQVIEIIQFDHRCRKALRRVKVKSVSREGGFLNVVGTNMRGKNSIRYLLRDEPAESIEPSPDTILWQRFVDDGQTGEE